MTDFSDLREQAADIVKRYPADPRAIAALLYQLIVRLDEQSGQPQNPIVKFLQFILDGAENVDLNHRDFRIQVAQMAQIEMDKIAAISRPNRTSLLTTPQESE
jgi:hypothetical protein